MKEYDYDFPKFPKFTILPWLIWAAVVGAVIAAVLYASKVHSEEIPVHVYDGDGVTMRLLRSACSDPKTGMMIATQVPQYLERFKAIESVWRMQDGSSRGFKGCWAEFPKGEIGNPVDVLVLVFEDGQNFVVPKEEFLRKPGQGGA